MAKQNSLDDYQPNLDDGDDDFEDKSDRSESGIQIYTYIPIQLLKKFK